jgi:hypothetical protein
MPVSERVGGRLLLGKRERHGVTMSETVVVRERGLAEVSTSTTASGRFGAALNQSWAWIAAAALAILLWAPRLSGPIDLRWDAGVYYVLGTSLSTGQGYRILSEPGSPEALQYPPLLPAVVALYERALGSTAPAVVGPWLRLSYAALFFFYSLAVLALAKRYLRPTFALLATALCLLHHSTIFLSDVLFADLPFALVSVLFALVVVRGDSRWPQRAWPRELLSFALATAGFFLRTAGVVLFAAWVIEALARKGWRLALARTVVAFLPVFIWQMHVERVRRSDEYRHPAYTYQRAPYQFYNVSYADNVLLTDPSRPELGRAGATTLALRIAKNFPYVAKAVGEAVSASDFYWQQSMSHLADRLSAQPRVLRSAIFVPIVGMLGLVVAGLIVLARRGAWLVVFYIVGSIGLICVTPWRFQFPRYVAPVTPFLTIAAVVAFSTIDGALRTARLNLPIRIVGRLAVAGLLTLTFAVQVCTGWELFAERKRDGASFVPSRGAAGPRFFYHDSLWRGWEQAIAWIDAHTPGDAIIATAASHLCYLRAGRHAVSAPIERDPAKARQLLESVPVSYVIVDRGYSLPAIEDNLENWHLAQSFDGTKLYEHTGGAQRNGNSLSVLR